MRVVGVGRVDDAIIYEGRDGGVVLDVGFEWSQLWVIDGNGVPVPPSESGSPPWVSPFPSENLFPLPTRGLPWYNSNQICHIKTRSDKDIYSSNSINIFPFPFPIIMFQQGWIFFPTFLNQRVQVTLGKKGWSRTESWMSNRGKCVRELGEIGAKIWW